MLQLTKKELKALLAFASNDDTRSHMCAVHVTAEGVVFASDGARAVRYASGVEGASTTIPKATLETIYRTMKAKDLAEIKLAETEIDVYTPLNDGTTRDTTAPTTTVAFEPLTSYPNIQRVFDQHAREVESMRRAHEQLRAGEQDVDGVALASAIKWPMPFAIDARFFDSIRDVAKLAELGGSRQFPTNIAPGATPQSPVMFTFPTNERWSILICPMLIVRCDNCTCVLGMDADDWGYDATYFDDERAALVAARSARWYVDGRKILCPGCCAQAIQAMQEE